MTEKHATAHEKQAAARGASLKDALAGTLDREPRPPAPPVENAPHPYEVSEETLRSVLKGPE
jgi:hypothetical protein